MKKATLSLFLLVLFVSFSIKSMNITDLCLYTQTSSYHNYSYPNNPEIPLLSPLFYFLLPTALRLMYLTYESLKSDTDKQTPHTNLLWIKTSDNKTFLMDIKKDLPQCGVQYLLKKYSRKFGHHNSRETPLKTGCSLSDYQLLSIALNAIDHDMSQWNFTEQEHMTLLQLASPFKIPNLYCALLDPNIQNNTPMITQDSNKLLTPLLSQLTKEIHTPRSKIMMRAMQPIKHTKNSLQPPQQDRKYTHDRQYYVKDRILYDADNDRCIITIPKHTGLTSLTNKKSILLSSTQKNTLFIIKKYDVIRAKKYHLPITSLDGCHKPYVSPDENYIATFSRTNSQGKYNESLIHIWNISDIDNIRYHKPLYHPDVCQLLFSPDSRFLISGADHNSVKLWNLEELSNEDISPILLLYNKEIDTIIFNKDGKTLATKHSSDMLCHILNIINIETLDSHIIIPTTHYLSSIFTNNSDLIMYSTYDKEREQWAFKIITKENIELYSKKIKANPTDSQIHSVISNNNQHIAVNCLRKNKCDILTVDHSLAIKKTTIDGHCDYINDDGSFYTHTPDAIHLYDAETYNCTTLYHAPQELLSTVKISPHKKRIEYIYNSDRKKTRTAYRKLLDAEMYKDIKDAATEITPLQYMLINKACDKPRKHHKTIPIQYNSLDHHALQSFGHHQELIAQTLKLQIADK